MWMSIFLFTLLGPLTQTHSTCICGYLFPSKKQNKLSNDVHSTSVELPWPSGYELQLSLERLRVLILVKVIGG